MIREIVARVADARIELIIHWQGGDHTELSVVKNRTGQHRWTTSIEVQALVSQLARQLKDSSIASLLNRLGHRTGKELSWTETRVRAFRCTHGIDVYKEGEREQRGELTLEQAAELLGTSKMTVLRMISTGAINASQACKGAPWVIKRCELQRAQGRAAGQAAGSVRSQTDPKQISLQLQ